MNQPVRCSKCGNMMPYISPTVSLAAIRTLSKALGIVIYKIDVDGKSDPLRILKEIRELSALALVDKEVKNAKI